MNFHYMYVIVIIIDFHILTFKLIYQGLFLDIQISSWLHDNRSLDKI